MSMPRPGRSRFAAGVFLAATLLGGASPSRAAGGAAPPVPPDQFGRLHALIRPAPGESKWAAIPWETCLWTARRKAAAEGKPLLIWAATEGHPLALT